MSAMTYDRPIRCSLAALTVLLSLMAAAPAVAAERLAGPYAAEILSVSADGSFRAAIRTWFGQVTIAKVKPRKVETVSTEPLCGWFVAGDEPAIGRGKRVFLSQVSVSSGADGYVADIRHVKTTGPSRSRVPVVLRGGQAEPCLKR